MQTERMMKRVPVCLLKFDVEKYVKHIKIYVIWIKGKARRRKNEVKLKWVFVCEVCEERGRNGRRIGRERGKRCLK